MSSSVWKTHHHPPWSDPFISDPNLTFALIKSKKSTFLFNFTQKLKEKMDDDFIKKRLERDMAELKRLCEDHFAKRREDDAKMEELKERIVTTKSVSTYSKIF